MYGGKCRVVEGYLRKSIAPASDEDTRGKAFDIPLPWTNGCLVEVVDVEEQAALRRGVQPKVGQMGVTTDLRLNARRRCCGQVFGHHDRGSSEESERGHAHPRMPNRNEVWQTRRLLLFQ